MRFRVLLLALACGSAALAARGQQWGVRTDGTSLQDLAPPGTHAVALFFVATDCPVSDRTFPEMARLRDKYRIRGVQFWFVYPNTGERPAAIDAHQQAFDAGGMPLRDPAGSLVRLAHAVATPEMAVLIPSGKGDWRSVYTGRIDNRYIRLGLERPAATQHFGDDALAAVLAGRTPKPAVGAPVGCAIMNPGAR